MELGAFVVNGNHQKTLNLIDELGLTSKLQPIVPQFPKQFIYNNNIYDNTIYTKLSDTLKKVMKGFSSQLSNKDFVTRIHNMSLYKLIKVSYNKKLVKLLMYSFGYPSDFIYQDALEGIKMFEHDYGNKSFYHMTNGLSQITAKLENIITSSNVEIKTGVTLEDIIKDTNNYTCKTNKGNYHCTNIILSLPKGNLTKLPYLRNISNILNTVKQNSHIRIYAKYPIINGKVWFHNMPSYTTNGIINNIVPIDMEKGWIMFYSDNKNADLWHRLQHTDTHEDILHITLNKIFDNVPRHTELVISYKKIGTHMWKPGQQSNVIRDQIMKPHYDDNIFIIGECYSSNQQWMVGAINSVDDLLEKKLI